MLAQCSVEDADQATVALEQINDSVTLISDMATQMTIQIALEKTGGNLRQAAKILGVTERALQMRRASQRKKLSEDTSS